jgi:sec-independent protein translocase protein TatA
MFDPSAPHIIILLIVVLLLFGARRLPGAAKSLGESMHIFKRSVQGMSDDDATDTKDPKASLHQTALSVPAAPQQIDAQPSQTQQLADLQRQISDLQRQNAAAEGDSATVGQQPF